MDASDIAGKFPKIYHVTRPSALPLIHKHGLLTAMSLVDLFEVPHTDRDKLLRRKRLNTQKLNHPVHGEAWLSDNKPIYEASLIPALENNLELTDWMGMLNARTFYWPKLRNAKILRNASAYRKEQRVIIEIDTLEFAKRNLDRIEITPFNSGSANRIAAKRGLSTFTPLSKYSYYEWRRLRQKKRQIRFMKL